MSEAFVPEIPQAVRDQFEPIVKALGPARQALANAADVVAVRPGYDYADPVRRFPQSWSRSYRARGRLTRPGSHGSWACRSP